MTKGNRDASDLTAKAALIRAHQTREIWAGFWRSVGIVGPAALKWGCIAWCGSKAADVLIAWTGSRTRADVKLHVITDALSEPQTGYLLPWVVAFALWLLYRHERGLKENALSRLGEMTRRYELLSDPANPRDLP